MIKELCEPHHLLIIIAVLILAIVSLGGGKGLGTLIGPLFKKIFGKGTELTVSLGPMETEMGRYADKMDSLLHQGPACPLVDPTKCTSHQAEHERSLENKENIEKLFSAVSGLKEEIRSGNERILLALVAGGQIKVTDIPPQK